MGKKKKKKKKLKKPKKRNPFALHALKRKVYKQENGKAVKDKNICREKVEE